MPRRHALQSRAGPSRVLNVRLTDFEHDGLARLATRRAGPTVSQLVRRAVETHVLVADPSPFFAVFARVVEDLAQLGVHPVLVGEWAAAAHGALSPSSKFELVVKAADVDALHSYLSARGTRRQARPLPFTVGREPWRIAFRPSYGGVPAEQLPATDVAWGGVGLAVLELGALLELGRSELEEHALDALEQLQAGTYDLDDGERGLVGLDAVGRLTASAWYPDPLTRDPHRFVDCRVLSS